MSLWLDEDEIMQLTGYRRRQKQYHELARQGVEFRARADGFPLVKRAQFENSLQPKRRREPDFSAIRGN